MLFPKIQLNRRPKKNPRPKRQTRSSRNGNAPSAGRGGSQRGKSERFSSIRFANGRAAKFIRKTACRRATALHLTFEVKPGLASPIYVARCVSSGNTCGGSFPSA